MGEKHHVTTLNAPVADRRRQVSLARAVRARDDEPAERLVAEIDRLTECGLKLLPALGVVGESLGIERLEGEPRQVPKIAVAQQSGVPVILHLLLLALASDEPPELRMADRHVGREPAPAPAALAGLRLLEKVFGRPISGSASGSQPL